MPFSAYPEWSSAPRCDLDDIKSKIDSFTIEPFSHDSVTFGAWRISASACGFFLSGNITGYRFHFSEEEKELLFECLDKLENNQLNIARYATGSGHISVNGKSTKISLRKVSSANDFFSRGLAKLKLNVLCFGQDIDYCETNFAAIVA